MAGSKKRAQWDAHYAAAIEAEEYFRSEHSLERYVRYAWDILEPKRPYLSNFHIGLICEHLEALTLGQLSSNGEYGKLIVNIPPRYMKSTICTVAWPTWVWIRKPEKRFIAASYSQSLSLKHSMDRRTLIESDWYQRAWGKRFALRDDQNTKSDFQNSRRGAMRATSVGGTATGLGGDFLVVDDPVDPKRAASEPLRNEANSWFTNTFERRLDDKKDGGIVVVMQRLHDKDLTGHLLEQGGWTHLKVEAECTKRTVYSLPISGKEIVREEGQIMWPERESKTDLEKAKKNMGPGYGAQMQQDPTPMSGGFFKRSWWQRYKALPLLFDRTIMMIDCAEKPGLSNDYTVMSVIGETPNGLFWKEVYRDRIGFPELVTKTLDMSITHRPDVIVVEDKSAGTQLIQLLKEKTKLPIEAYNPRGDKVVRASAAQPTVKSGNCHLPEEADWVEDFLKEHEKFPKADHDDQVDTTSMLVIWLRDNQGAMPEPNARIIG